MTSEDEKQVEYLLGVWFRWHERQSRAAIMQHFYPPTDRSCGYDPDLEHIDEDSEDAERRYDARVGEQVELCVEKLDGAGRASVFTTMRNRSGTKVWRTGRIPDHLLGFHEAKVTLFPLMLARHLIKDRAA